MHDRPRLSGAAIAAALVVGIVLGFAGGYGVGTYRQPDAQSPAQAGNATPAAAPDADRPAAPAPTPSTTGQASAAKPPAAAAPPTPRPSEREFTESSVPAAGKSSASADPPRAAAPAEASGSETGRLLVRSTPAGASVTVDGKDYGHTPVAVRELARGTHRLRVARDGYTAVERRFVISPSRPSQSLTIALTRPGDVAARGPQAAPAPHVTTTTFTGALVVDSRPPGARVFVDGKLAGTTPMSVADLRAGEHVIRLERDGYRLWSSSVRVVASEQNRVTASLER